MINKTEFSFWNWLFKFGFKKLVNPWAFFHLLFGSLFSLLIPINLSNTTFNIIAPLMGILIGLTFAWGGNAMVLLQSKEIQLLTSMKKEGLSGYLYTYQFSILILLTTIILWSFVGLMINIQLGLNVYTTIFKLIGKIVLLALSSLSIRECWHVILSTHWLLISKLMIEDMKSDDVDNQKTIIDLLKSINNKLIGDSK
jgi:hypothetical protein